MTISPIRSIAAAAEGGTLQPGVLPPGLIVTASGQVVGFQAGGISPARPERRVSRRSTCRCSAPAPATPRRTIIRRAAVHSRDRSACCRNRTGPLTSRAECLTWSFARCPCRPFPSRGLIPPKVTGVAFRDALAHVTAPEAGFWRTDAARELERIARCRSAPAEPLRHTVVPGPDEHPAGLAAARGGLTISPLRPPTVR